MPQEYAPSTLRICDFEEEPYVVGVGFLLSFQHAVTCLHVIEDAFKPASVELGGEVRIKLYSKETEFKATLRAMDVKDDLAILELPQALSMHEDIQSIPSQLFRFVSLQSAPYGDFGHEFIVEGFPDRDAVSTTSKGTILNRKGKSNRIQLLQGENGASIRPGCSGALLWDATLQQVAGVVTERHRDRGERVAYAIPMDCVNTLLLSHQLPPLELDCFPEHSNEACTGHSENKDTTLVNEKEQFKAYLIKHITAIFHCPITGKEMAEALNNTIQSFDVEISCAPTDVATTLVELYFERKVLLKKLIYNIFIPAARDISTTKNLDDLSQKQWARQFIELFGWLAHVYVYKKVDVSKFIAQNTTHANVFRYYVKRPTEVELARARKTEDKASFRAHKSTRGYKWMGRDAIEVTDEHMALQRSPRPVEAAKKLADTIYKAIHTDFEVDYDTLELLPDLLEQQDMEGKRYYALRELMQAQDEDTFFDIAKHLADYHAYLGFISFGGVGEVYMLKTDHRGDSGMHALFEYTHQKLLAFFPAIKHDILV